MTHIRIVYKYFSYTWTIPLLYVTSESSEPQFAWINDTDVTLDVTSQIPSDGWVVANHQQLGLYRVNYDAANWAALAKQLKTNHEVCELSGFDKVRSSKPLLKHVMRALSS